MKEHEAGDRFTAYCPTCEAETYGEVDSPAGLGGVPWQCDDCGDYIDLDSEVSWSPCVNSQ